VNPYASEHLSRGGVASHVVDPWIVQDPGDHPLAPCVSIPVTAAMRVADAALQVQREKAGIGFGVAWREKLQLSETNLRIVRAARVQPGRVAEQRHIVRQSSPRLVRHCSVCQAEIKGTTKSSLCSAHRPRWTESRVACERGCGKNLPKSSPHTVCQGCRRAERAAGRPEPKPRAPRTRKASALPLARLKCPTDGCTMLMRAGRGANADGSRNGDTCQLCSCRRWMKLHKTERQRQHRKNRNNRLDRHCSVCKVLVSATSRTGRCRLHAPAVRFSYVPAAKPAVEMEETA
jgi:hypothetical protein